MDIPSSYLPFTSEGRLEFFSEASEVLSSSLDYRMTLAAVAHLAVPRIADWCAVHIVGPGGKYERLAVAHSDPEKVKWARAIPGPRPPDSTAARGISRVIQTGKSEFFALDTDGMPEDSAGDSGRDELLHLIGARSALIVPLLANGEALGAISLMYAESGREYRPVDLKFAEDIGRRAGLAVANAMLFEQVREQREWLEITLASIGDAVIATDAAGSVTFINPVAEFLTGWCDGLAVGRPIEEVFNVLYGQSRQPVESGVAMLLRGGQRPDRGADPGRVQRDAGDHADGDRGAGADGAEAGRDDRQAGPGPGHLLPAERGAGRVPGHQRADAERVAGDQADRADRDR